MKLHLRAVLLTVSMLLAAPLARAALIIEGSFAANLPTLQDFSGSFSATFDDSALAGIGIEGFFDLDIVTALTFSPSPYYGFVPGASNTVMNLVFSAGVLDSIVIGAGAGAAIPGEFVGDWALSLDNQGLGSAAANAPGPNSELAVSVEGNFSVREGNAVSAPATLALLVLGLLGLRLRSNAWPDSLM